LATSLARWGVPGFPKKHLDLRDGLLKEWSEFCGRFGRQATKQAEHARRPGQPPTVDWLGGTQLTEAKNFEVSIQACPLLARVVDGARRPAVWCLYRVETLPVRRGGDIIGVEAVPVPVSVGAARSDAVTRYPSHALALAHPTWFWCRAWNDDEPEDTQWGTAVSSAAWMVGVINGLVLPEELRAA
jgi:hypothetical protein